MVRMRLQSSQVTIESVCLLTQHGPTDSNCVGNSSSQQLPLEEMLAKEKKDKSLPSLLSLPSHHRSEWPINTPFR